MPTISGENRVPLGVAGTGATRPTKPRSTSWLSDLLPARSRITDDSLTGYDVKTGKVRPMTKAEFTQFQVARGKEFGRLLREVMGKPSDAPSLTPHQRELIQQQDAEGDKALPDLPLQEARKAVSLAHRQALEVGKAAVFGGDVVPLSTK